MGCKHGTEGACTPCQAERERAELRAEIERLRDEWETRADGVRVRKDRWEWAVRRIVALLWGNHQAFEVDEVVDAVRALVPKPHAEGDDEALVRAVQSVYGPNAR